MTEQINPYIIIQSRAAMAQSVEHVLGKDEVTSSSLVSSSSKALSFGGAFSFIRPYQGRLCDTRGSRNIKRYFGGKERFRSHRSGVTECRLIRRIKERRGILVEFLRKKRYNN